MPHRCAPHDAAYKSLFSDPEMVASLLRDFVPESFVAELDFSTLERCSGSYVSDDLRERHDDMIWRVRWQGEIWCYLYILTEFQSTVDAWMAVRVLTYTALLWQDLIRTGRVREGEPLPPVFPLVIYNGSARWTAAQDTAGLLPPLSAPLAAWQPRQRYFLLDEGRISEARLAASEGLAGLLLRFERAREPEELLPLLDELSARLSEPRYQRLHRAFTVWLARVVLHRTGMTAAATRMNDLQEVRTMLAERVMQWKDEYIRQGVIMGREEGLEQGLTLGREEGLTLGREEGLTLGREQGLTLGLRTLLESRLGSLPPQVTACLAGINNTEQLCALTLAASRVSSYEEFLEELMRSTE